MVGFLVKKPKWHRYYFRHVRLENQGLLHVLFYLHIQLPVKKSCSYERLYRVSLSGSHFSILMLPQTHGSCPHPFASGFDQAWDMPQPLEVTRFQSVRQSQMPDVCSLHTRRQCSHLPVLKYSSYTKILPISEVCPSNSIIYVLSAFFNILIYVSLKAFLSLCFILNILWIYLHLPKNSKWFKGSDGVVFVFFMFQSPKESWTVLDS